MAINDKLLISMVMNTGSGHHAYGHEVLAKELKSFFMDHGYDVEMYLPTETNELSQLVQLAIIQHRRRKGIIVAAGGDGTLNCVAQKLQNTNIPLGIIPLGTFNYVARALNIPLDVFEAAQVIVDGHYRAINVGLVNQYVYLNNASIGLYPKIIEQRETDNARFGRFRAVAMISGFAVLMREQQKLRLQMMVDGQEEPLESPLIFFGNNQLQLKEMNLQLATCVEQGKLAAVAITPLTRWQLLKLIHRLQRGTFEQAPEVSAFCADVIKINAKVKTMKVAIDGEIVRVKTPLIFKIAHQALQVMVPHVTASV
jgi:diacylglycerol kinase family enzyme